MKQIINNYKEQIQKTRMMLIKFNSTSSPIENKFLQMVSKGNETNIVLERKRINSEIDNH